MLASETPQDSVNAARPRPANCDIVIVILWSRMGTPLPDNVHKPNGEPYLSGIEWDEDAVNSPQQPRPQVLVYRRTEKPKVELDDPDLDEKWAQFKRVEAFFAQFCTKVRLSTLVTACGHVIKFIPTGARLVIVL